MISFQSYVGSAYASNPVRWIETPEAARSRYVTEQIPDTPVEKAVDVDLGKPRSASGDILDISKEAQETLNQAQNLQKSGEKDAGNKRSEGDSVTISNAGRGETDAVGSRAEKSDRPTDRASDRSGTERSERTVTLGGEVGNKAGGTLATDGELTPEQQQQLVELQARDQEVRIHEMAHVLAGGQYVTSGPSYEYQIGPDGKGYAIGGSVGIDTAPVAGDPEATIEKMQTVAAAAMAPAQPSSQDHKVAAAARQAESKARAELSQLRSEEMQAASSTEAEDGELEANGSEGVAAFTIIRAADKVAGGETTERSSAAEHTLAAPSATEASSKAEAEDAVMSSLIRTQPKASADFAPSSAYKAQSIAPSTMTLASPRFSAFA